MKKPKSDKKSFDFEAFREEAMARLKGKVVLSLSKEDLGSVCKTICLARIGK